MKRLLIVAVPIISILGGIGIAAHNAPKTNQKPTVSEKPAAPLQVAKETCGDSGSADNWFPVFIDGGNLADIQSKFCKDAIAKTREKTGSPTVQLASFSDRRRAEEFAKSVGGEVGESYSAVSVKKVEEDPVKTPETKMAATASTPAQEFISTLSKETEGILANDEVRNLAPAYYQNRRKLWIAISGIPATEAVSIVAVSLQNLAIEKGIRHWDDEKVSKMAVGIVRGMYRWNREHPKDLVDGQTESIPEASSENSSGTAIAQVIDPPSNCRASGKKDSEVVTVFKDKQSIQVSTYALVGGWHFVQSDRCYIHKSQISF